MKYQDLSTAFGTANVVENKDGELMAIIRTDHNEWTLMASDYSSRYTEREIREVVPHMNLLRYTDFL